MCPKCNLSMAYEESQFQCKVAGCGYGYLKCSKGVEVRVENGYTILEAKKPDSA